MNDPKGFIPVLFAYAHLKNYYIHEQESDDSLFQGALSFE